MSYTYDSNQTKNETLKVNGFSWWYLKKNVASIGEKNYDALNEPCDKITKFDHVCVIPDRFLSDNNMMEGLFGNIDNDDKETYSNKLGDFMDSKINIKTCTDEQVNNLIKVLLDKYLIQKIYLNTSECENYTYMNIVDAISSGLREIRMRYKCNEFENGISNLVFNGHLTKRGNIWFYHTDS
ncbi:MAG: hypothetical protein Terrestrivirus11_35 [Terrestrivirus sp.]|uniref:Uncharacterized protein n=1 Tax=Terrestrivirus sp. TaxID=2487775 RepID=A0A3G4ZQU3_9VIRU|nr:MAG: hypothetical protein Terrestrivirus11_35 [Terrestrivirus sp.]